MQDIEQWPFGKYVNSGNLEKRKSAVRINCVKGNEIRNLVRRKTCGQSVAYGCKTKQDKTR